jgi:hypothetical protein
VLGDLLMRQIFDGLFLRVTPNVMRRKHHLTDM